MTYQKIAQNLARNSLVYLFLTLGRQNKSMDSSFNEILDHVENSSFLPYAGPQCTPSKRKVDNGEKKRKKKIMTFIVATNVVASRTPERRPTGMPHSRANYSYSSWSRQNCQNLKKS